MGFDQREDGSDIRLNVWQHISCGAADKVLVGPEYFPLRNGC